ncbi:MAG TPA: S8 family serine peptidase [Solirubrobacterales bacterium]|nr:S8 family serine peptidase [Solirubrobacterales bacterium]
MMLMHSSRRAGRLAIALLLVVIATLPSSAVARRGSGELAPRLAKLAVPALHDASARRQAEEVDLAVKGPGSLARQGARVLVDVRFDRGVLAALDDLRAGGAKTLDASRRYQAATVAAKPSQLHAIAAVAGVAGVSPILSPVTAAACPAGEVVSEGDGHLLAAAARAANPGVDGGGVTVGILSDSFDQATEAADGSGEIATHAEEDVKSADLPGTGNECPGQATPVTELSKIHNASEASDEGRAMAQIVHDLAPGAELEFASAFNGETAFADGIRALASAGAEVIADDVFYYEEPFFQDGPVAVAINEVVADGVTYLSAAGNDNLLDGEGHDIASWETPEYRDSQSCPPAVRALPGANGSHCLDFNPGSQTDKTFGMRVEPGETLTVDLQWDEPWHGVGADLDAFLLSAGGALLAESYEDNVEISQMPFELVQWTNESAGTRTVQLVVNRFSDESLSPRVKFVLIQNGGGVSATEYPRSSGEDVVGPTIFGHSGSASAIAVGAVPFSSKSKPEPYSSRGPVSHSFGPVEGTSPAPSIPSENLSKPDLVATDCGRTTFFSFFGTLAGVEGWHFCGTSAAAPHAAAVAALMLDAKPTAGPEDIRGALVASAKPVGLYGPCAVGAGLVEAVGAVEKVLAGTGATGPACEPPESEVDPEEAAAAGDWGSEGGSSPGSRTVTPQPPVVNPPPPEPPKLAPRTFFLQRPGKLIRTSQRRAKAVFRFGSNQPDVSFVCRIDGGLFRPCSARLVRRFGPGWHTIKVAARDRAGNGDLSPASYRFKVTAAR